MPAPFRAYQDIGVSLERHRGGIALDVGNDLDIFEIGKGEAAGIFPHAEAKPAPKWHQLFLDVAVDAGVALFLTELETRACQLDGGVRFAEFLADRHAFE